MDKSFWLTRWAKNRIGFHQAEYNKHLLRYWPELNLPPGSGVFVPLCGKSKDMHWLAGCGHEVVGIELSHLAIDAYFAEQHETPSVRDADGLAQYSGESARLYLGDFFDLTTPHLTGVTACFDRGALVALPPSTRPKYADHLLRVLPQGAQILLLTLEYDQGLVAGPPHSVGAGEVEQLYSSRCQISQLASLRTTQVPPHFAEQGVKEAVEAVYRMTKVE